MPEMLYVASFGLEETLRTSPVGRRHDNPDNLCVLL